MKRTVISIALLSLLVLTGCGTAEAAAPAVPGANAQVATPATAAPEVKHVQTQAEWQQEVRPDMLALSEGMGAMGEAAEAAEAATGDLTGILASVRALGVLVDAVAAHPDAPNAAIGVPLQQALDMYDQAVTVTVAGLEQDDDAGVAMGAALFGRGNELAKENLAAK
jgi:hypothetical protein